MGFYGECGALLQYIHTNAITGFRVGHISIAFEREIERGLSLRLSLGTCRRIKLIQSQILIVLKSPQNAPALPLSSMCIFKDDG